MAVRKYAYSDAVLYSKINIFCHCYYHHQELLSLHGILPINIEELQAKNEEFFDVISDNLQKVNWKNIINQRQTKRAEIASMIKFIRFTVENVYKDSPYILNLFTFGLQSRLNNEEYITRVALIAERCEEYAADLAPNHITATYIAALRAKNEELRQLIAMVPEMNTIRKQTTAQRIQRGNAIFETTKYYLAKSVFSAENNDEAAHLLFSGMLREFIAPANKGAKRKNAASGNAESGMEG